MTYDFSSLFNTETIDIKRGDTVLFQVTVQEIPHGKVVQSQNEMFKLVDVDFSQSGNGDFAKSMMRQLGSSVKSGKFEVSEYSDNQKLLGIHSWTLTDKAGNPAPVCVEAYQALPHWITEQIEKEVERLNPNLDKAFHSESGNTGTA